MEIPAKVMAETACYWVRDHEKQFKTLMWLIHEQVDGGNPCVQEGDMSMLARRHGIEWSEIRELKRDHNMWAVLTRYMVMLSPRLAKVLHFRRSKVDDLDLQAIWYSINTRQTFFYVDSWKEAKEAVKRGDFK